ncbi:MAG: class I SAM-dependent methyltransferase [Reichenbachiella sp.]|uniref:class I SAM-dependent methyltransferase n=1 Tax=Reichenbachiella sp. TaxID=2184521 RepID=UPI002965E9E9|nr:class I SAM-dependent methyltransferase [Reichenbachiella sp.]MDW3210008.1 class I SAM-dependent methyltransferase [Reichenbachiella sp.]
MSDKEFWEDFYSKKKGILEPSPFAQYVIKEHHLSGSLVELGCGNGRDSIYFIKNKLEVFGTDQCQTTIGRLKDLKLEGGKFEVKDFTTLGELGKFDNIYSRFTLHSVSEKQASQTLTWAFDSLNVGGKLCIEVRSIHDELYGEGTEVERDAFVTDHYRRFVRIDELTKELETLGFKIEYSEESKGFAVYKNEDPAVIRVVATRS